MDVRGPMLEFLRWLDARPRSYAETMEAWQTSCPRLSVWEDAHVDGLVSVGRGPTLDASPVELTELGRGALAGEA